MDHCIQKRKQKWIDFMDMGSSVNRILVIDCQEGKPQAPMLWWEQAEQRIEWSYARYMRQMEDVQWLADDRVPALTMITGTEVFAEAFGCAVHKPLDNNPFALPLISSSAELSRVKFPRLEDTQLMKLFDMAHTLRSRAGQDALLSLPDVQTPLDIAALIWEKTDFFVAMLEEPEAVRELSEKIKQFLFSFFDLWFATFGKEFQAHYPDYYMPCGITMSEDEIGAVSTDLYDEFFKDELHEFARRYGAIGIHCCADSEHQWGRLAAVPNLKLLNLVRPPKSTALAVDRFAGVCAQYHNENNLDYSSIASLQSAHMGQMISVRTRKEALAALETFRTQGHL